MLVPVPVLVLGRAPNVRGADEPPVAEAPNLSGAPVPVVEDGAEAPNLSGAPDAPDAEAPNLGIDGDEVDVVAALPLPKLGLKPEPNDGALPAPKAGRDAVAPGAAGDVEDVGLLAPNVSLGAPAPVAPLPNAGALKPGGG